MADQIKVNESEFDIGEQGYTQMIETLEQHLGVLRQKHETMFGAWDGKSGENFLKAAVGVEKEYSDVINEIKNLREEVIDAKTKFMQADVDLSKKMDADGKGLK